MKKILSYFLAIILIICAVPFGTFTLTASANLNFGEEYYTYAVLNGEAEIIDVDTSISGDVILPSMYGEYPVTSIRFSAFYGCSKLTGITIPETVVSIESSAFSGCTALKTINLHNNFKKIGWLAFNDTAYYKDQSNWKDGVLYIGNYLIDTQNTIPSIYKIKDGTKVIADMAFNYRLNLTNVSIPNSVTSIGRMAFCNCENLKSIIIPDSVTTIDYGAFGSCYNATSLIIGKGVTSVGESAFSGCDSLTKVTIPASVTNIGTRAFVCSSLTEINVDKNNNYFSSLNGVLFNKNKTRLVQYPISKIGSCYTVPSSVTRIGTEAFVHCKNLTGIIIPDSVTGVDDNAICTNGKITIYGFEGSYAQAYAKYLKVPFVTLEYSDFWDETTVDSTGVYGVLLRFAPDADKTLIGALEEDLFVIQDKNENIIKFNSARGGYPLIAGEKYKIIPNNDFEFTGYTMVKTASTLFSDTGAGNWYSDAVAYAAGVGLMTGYQNGKFGTSDSIQRQDFLVMLARLEGVDLESYGARPSAFPDVPEGSYFEAAVNWGSENGIVTGYDNGKFGVGDKVTREQLVTFLYRYAKYKGYDYSYTSDRETVVSGQYNDYKKVSGFSKDPILWAIEKGVISGKTSTTIAPQGNAQRCEVAKIMYNIYLNNIFS